MASRHQDIKCSLLLVEDFMTKYILSQAGLVANEKVDKGIPLQMSDSNGGPTFDSVIILKDKQRQNEKGKGPMIEEKTVPIENTKKKNCDENDSMIGNLPKSDYKRKRSRKANINKAAGISLGKETFPVSKRLFQSPTTSIKSPRTSKGKTPRQKTVLDGEDTSGDSPIVHTCQSLNHITPNKGFKHYIPKKFRSKFIPISEMGLNEMDHEVALYVYGTQYDESEVVFKCGELVMKRKDFLALCPGKTITKDVIELLAMKVTMSKCLVAHPKTWVLPPSFTDDTLNGLGVDVMLNTYKDPWMRNSSDLRYHLFMRNVILDLEAANDWGNGWPDIVDWQLQDTEGIPNCGDRSFHIERFRKDS